MTAPVDPHGGHLTAALGHVLDLVDRIADQLPDPAAVQATDDEIEALRAGRLPSNADRLVEMLAAWRDDIIGGES